MNSVHVHIMIHVAMHVYEPANHQSLNTQMYILWLNIMTSLALRETRLVTIFSEVEIISSRKC